MSDEPRSSLRVAPSVRRVIAQRLVDGQSKSQIARELHIDRQTVTRVERDPETKRWMEVRRSAKPAPSAPVATVAAPAGGYEPKREDPERITVAADQSSAWKGYELMTDGTMRRKPTGHVKFVTDDPNDGRRRMSSVSPRFLVSPKIDWWDNLK
jgi:DNA-binding XRE family transcriptional regulator